MRAKSVLATAATSLLAAVAGASIVVVAQRCASTPPVRSLGAGGGVEASVPAESHPLSAQEERLEAIRVRGRMDAQFNAERLDPDWGPRTEAAFRDDLSRIGQSMGGTVVDIQCRATLCRAEVQWPSYEDAAKNWQVLLHAPYRMQCGRHVFVPLADDADAAYVGTVFFDCAKPRQG
jgi:hypothetical protein